MQTSLYLAAVPNMCIMYYSASATSNSMWNASVFVRHVPMRVSNRYCNVCFTMYISTVAVKNHSYIFDERNPYLLSNQCSTIELKAKITAMAVQRRVLDREEM